MKGNFFRSGYYNEINERVVEICKSKDRMAMLKHVVNTDLDGLNIIVRDEHWNARPTTRRIFDIIVFEKLNSICDIGCGTGVLITKLKEVGCSVTGVDISPVRILMAPKNLRIFLAFSEDLPLEESTFDCVVMQECLEHVMDIGKTLSEVNRIIKKGGRLLLTVPLENHSDCPNHVRQFDKATLYSALDEAGFRVEFIELVKFREEHDLNCLLGKATKL